MENFSKFLFALLHVLILSSSKASVMINNGGSFSTVGGAGGTHSVFQTGGNNVVISRRFGLNDEVEDYISLSNPNIRIDGEYFSCSGLICPSNAFKCVVVSEAKAADTTLMKTVAECVDKSGTVLETKEFEEKNPFPDAQPPYSRHSTVDRDGLVNTEDSNGSNTFNSNSMTKEQQEKLTRQINEEMRRVNSQVQQTLENVHTNLRHTFGKNFPFGDKNPFGPNFPFGTQNPFFNTHNFNPYNYVYQNNQHNNFDRNYY